MSDIFNNEFADISEKDWRKFALEASRPLVDAPADTRVSRTADFAKQLEKANIAEQNAYITTQNARIDDARNAEREAKASAKEAKASAKELTKLGLPDVSEQRQLPGNWFDAQKATNYSSLPYEEQSKVYADWLDQAHVRVVTADRSKATTAREELEKRIPAPVKPKADFFNNDIIDKAQIGANSLLEGVYKVGASFMPEGNIKSSLYADAALADQAQKDIRASLSPETLDAEKATAFRKQQLVSKYGSEDAIPPWEGFKQGVSSMTQGGVLQTVGNVTQSLASSAPSVAGNVMRIGGAALSATGVGAAIGVPLMAAGTALATAGGAAATAADVGGDSFDEAFKFAKSQNKTDAEAYQIAESAARAGGLAGAGIGAVEGFIGAKLGAGSAIAKAGLKAGAKKLGVETLSEGVAEGVGRVATNAAVRNEGDQRSLSRGVTEAMAQGAIGGLGMGVGGQALASATGAADATQNSGPADLPQTFASAAAGADAASAATNTVAAAAQAAVVEAQAAVAAAQQTGDDTQVAAATAALQAASAQASAVAPTQTAPADAISKLEAAAAAQDALEAAQAKGDPVEIEQATAAFQTATQNITAPVVDTPAAGPDPRIEERASLTNTQIADMLNKVESIPQALYNAALGDTDALEAVKPLAGAVGRKDTLTSGKEDKQPWSVNISKGVSPIDAVANDATLEPAQREAAQAVVAAYQATGTALPIFDRTRQAKGNTSGFIEHANINSSVPAKVVLNRKLATPATIIHEYLHGLTVLGLDAMNRSTNPDHMAVLDALDAIVTFLREHPSVVGTKSGGVYAATNTRELLAEALSGRVLPLTSNITVQDIIDQGGLSPRTIQGLEILTNRQPTTLQQLFAKARDYILQAMGLAAAKKGSVSDAILSAADIAMGVQKDQVSQAKGFKQDLADSPFKNDAPGQTSNDVDTLMPGYEHLGKNANGNFATSLGQLTQGLVQTQDGIYRAADGTMLDTNDSIAQMADRPAVRDLLAANGFDGFMTEAGEKFKLAAQRNAEETYDFNNTVLGSRNGNVGGYSATIGDGYKTGVVQSSAAGRGVSAVDGGGNQRAGSWKSQPELGEIRNRISDYSSQKATLGASDQLELTPQAKALTTTIANISRVISSAKTTDAQRLVYLGRFLNGSHSADVMDAINQTGVGLTVRSAIESQAPWAEAVQYRDTGLLRVLATSAGDVGPGVAEQARAVLRMYAESGADMPKIVKIQGLIPFDGKEAMGMYTPAQHMIELSDLSDPSHAVHEYLHGVTQLGIDAMTRSKEGKALTSVMEYMLATMRTTAVREGTKASDVYGLTDAHEMMGDLFNPALLRVAVQTPVGKPQSKAAQAMITELLGEKPSTMIQLLDAIIRKIVSYLGVKTVPNNMAELLSRVAARVTDETRKAINDGFEPATAFDRPALFRNEEVLPASTTVLSPSLSKNQQQGRISSAAYINNINNGVNVQPLLTINKNKALFSGDKAQRDSVLTMVNDAVHDSQGPAKRWLQSMPISDNAKERIINILYLAPGKRDALLNTVMEQHGGDAVMKQLSAITKGLKGITHETTTQWVGHWITANHVAEKNAMLVAKRAKAHSDAVQASAARPGDFRLQLAAAKALQAYSDQVKAVSSTNLDAGSEGHPPHAMGVAGGMSNAQAAATMAAVENQIDVVKLREVAESIYDMNAFRLVTDIEHGKTTVESVAKFLTLSAQDQATLKDLQDARVLGTVTEGMRAAARAIVRSEYVPMTGHPLSAIDATEDGLFSAGAAQPNTGKDYAMEGRTRGIADNGIATSMKGLIRSATFAGFADFTTAIGEVHDMLTVDQRADIGLGKENITGMTRGSDNVLLDGRTNNTVGYSIADPKIMEAMRFANVDTQHNLLQAILHPMTKTFAYLVTQANPLFGPKNLLNDMIERSLIVSTREYHTETGSKITVGATDVVANSGMATAAVNRLIRGKADYSIDADAALRDFIESGGLSTSREAFARDAKQLAQRIRDAGAGAVGQKTVLRYVGGWVEKYNKQFDMVAPLASYLALRHAGVSKTDAAGGALDLMNYRKKGAKTAGFVTPMYAFAQPAFTGGANLVKMLGTRKGQAIAVTSFVALISLQMMAEAGADEDEGGNLIRQMPNYARNNNINVQLGGNVVSIPVGFGVTKFANTVARAIIDFGKKGNSLPKTLNDIMTEGFVPSISPFEDNDIKDPLKAAAYFIAPTVAKGASAYILNTRPDGGEIDREKWIDRAKYRHMQGSKQIEPEYRAMAINMYDAVGWDMTPDAMKYLVRTYALGPFKHIVAETITNPAKEAAGKDTGLPVVGSILSPVFKPLNEDAWKGQVRKAQEEMDDMRKEENRLKTDTTQDGRVALRELQRKPEYRLMVGYDVVDKELRNESAAITRSVTSKQITKSAEESRREAIRERRSDAEAQFLVKWRKMRGLE